MTSIKQFLQGNFAVFICGFRPFFVLTAGSAVLLMALWLLMFFGQLPITIYGGEIAWHAHEMIFGFVTAAVAGFALTAIPEFTKSMPPGRPVLVRLVLLWLAARVAYILASYWPSVVGLWPAAFFNLLLWLYLLSEIVPRTWKATGKKHMSFVWAISALMLAQLGFFIAQAFSFNAMSWLYVAVDLMMILIVIAASRISMSVMNGVVENKGGESGNNKEVVYLARPPRRNLAMFTIALCSISEFILGHDIITGWTALAATAGMLNLLNDWHVGRALFARWALMLYASYWLIALGYGAMGAAWLGAPIQPSAGRHLLMAGAMGLSVFTIMTIVGRIHSGLKLDRRSWLPITAVVLVVASLIRASAGVYAFAPWMQTLLIISGTLWLGCFLLYMIITWAVLTGPRTDGQEGCAEPAS